MITVRLFAAAAEAAGVESLDLDAAPDASVSAVRESLAARFGGELRRVLERSSVLVDGVRADDHDPVAAGSTVDVLPPFAGG